MKQKSSLQKAQTAAKYLLGATLLLCIAGLVVNTNGTDSTGIALAAIACALAAAIVIAVFVRCPYCGKRIIRQCVSAVRCPHCGRSLSTGRKGKKK